jgi:hypothetical protein
MFEMFGFFIFFKNKKLNHKNQMFKDIKDEIAMIKKHQQE